MRSSTKKSRAIRYYLSLWLTFFFGLLIILPFAETKTELRWVAFTGFLICMGSLLLTLWLLPQVQQDVKTQYSFASKKEKCFLRLLYYFSRATFFIFGLVIILGAYFGENIQEIDFVEIEGKIVSVDIDDRHLKIQLEKNSNSYGINTFKVPDESLEHIENDLLIGEHLYVLVSSEDEFVADDPFVQIYGLRTEHGEFLSPQDYQREVSINNKLRLM